MQTPLQNGLTISDLPGPTGGIMLKSATGATLIVNDTGIYIQNGKGAIDHLVGPTVTINNGALTVIWKMPGPLLHLGATVLCAHGGQAMPTAPNPRVLGRRPADGDDGRALRGGGLRVTCRRQARSLRDRRNGSWRQRACSCHGQPVVLMDSQAICAPTGTPLLPVMSQMRVIGS